MWLTAASTKFSCRCFFAKWAMFLNQPRSTKETSLKNVGLKKGSGEGTPGLLLLWKEEEDCVSAGDDALDGGDTSE